MSSGNRRAFIAIGLVFLCAAAIGWITFPTVPSLQRFEYQQPRNENYRPGGRDCEPAVLAAIPNGSVRSDRAQDCEEQAEEYRQASDDLIQQTRSANAAEVQAVMAGQAIWLGWFQTIGGLLTLAAAVAAAIYARDAAKEGKRTADTAEQSHSAIVEAERGILVQDDVYIADMRDPPEVIVTLENTGRSAATIIWTTCNIATGKLPAYVGHLSDITRRNIRIPAGKKESFTVSAKGDIGRACTIAGCVTYVTLGATFECYYQAKAQLADDTGYGPGDWEFSDMPWPNRPIDT